MELVYKNILVAVDGSKESERAFQKAVQIAKRNDAKLLLAHIIDTRAFATVDTYTYDTAVDSYDPTIVVTYDKLARDLLEKYRKEAVKSGIKEVNEVIDYGSPKELIPKDIADNNNVDLIICGAAGLNAVERFLIGSVSENIIRHAKCDVLVVRSKKESHN
jgi:nucleotide-binding universal stress UspA family protein